MTGNPGGLAHWIRLHRWLGLLAMAAVLQFGLSGIIHPVMSRTQPQPAARQAPPVVLPAGAQSLKAVLERAGIARFHAARLVGLDGLAAYRVEPETGSARLFLVRDGSELGDGEAHLAEALARHYTGDHASAIIETREIRAFDRDYPAVNRLLPVWRVRLARDDGMTAYVDTAGFRLATLNDDNKRRLQAWFRGLHTFAWLDAWPRLQLALMLVLLSSTLVTAIAGLVMYVRLRQAERRLRQQPMRRWHRRLALAIALTTFSFSLSGGWHLLQNHDPTPAPAPVVPDFLTASLGEAPAPGAFSLAWLDGAACYRVEVPSSTVVGSGQSGEHAHHHAMSATAGPPPARCYDTGSGAERMDSERRLAETLLRHFASNPDGPLELAPITRFGGEYGFINKRLPVWRGVFGGSDQAWYVETGSGALALRADRPSRLEGLSFAYLHKWIFFGEDHKDIRDVLLMSFAFGNILTAGLGAWVFFARRRRRPLTVAENPA